MTEIIVAALLLLNTADQWRPQSLPREEQVVDAIRIEANQTTRDYEDWSGREMYAVASNLSNRPIEAEISCEFFAAGNYIGEDSTSLLLGPRQWRVLIFYHDFTNLEVRPICYVSRRNNANP